MPGLSIAEEYERAAKNYNSAARMWADVAKQYDEIGKVYKETADKWKMVQGMLLVIAAFGLVYSSRRRR